MSDLLELADILQRWQRLDAAVSERCASYDLTTLAAFRVNLKGISKGISSMEQALLRRHEVMAA